MKRPPWTAARTVPASPLSSAAIRSMRNPRPPAGFIENSRHACEDTFRQESGVTDRFRVFNNMAVIRVVRYAEAKRRHSLPAN